MDLAKRQARSRARSVSPNCGPGQAKTSTKSRIYAAFAGDALRHHDPVLLRKAFGQNVHRLRVKRGLTQEEVCERAEIDRSYVQRIESGTSNPTVEVASRLRQALGCTWEELLRGV